MKTPSRILLYVIAGFVVWLWLSQIGNEATQSGNEARDIANAEAALKMGDSLRATRARARSLASAKADSGLALIRKAVPPPALSFAKDLADSARALMRENAKLRVTLAQVYQGAMLLNEARLIDSTRADQAEVQLAVMTSHTVVLMRRLEARRSFHVAFIKLPKPTKWQACLVGATVGLALDRQVRGAAAGCATTMLAVPTR